MTQADLIAPLFDGEMDTEYLNFVAYNIVGRKTDVIAVKSRRHGDELGQIKWYGAWRQYCFYPTEQTIFNADCSSAIEAVMRELNRRHREEAVIAAVRSQRIRGSFIPSGISQGASSTGIHVCAS